MTLLLIGLVVVSLGSLVASGPIGSEIDPEFDIDSSEFFYNPYQSHFGHGLGYGFNYPNMPFGAGFRGALPGLLPGAIPPVPYLFRK